MSVDPAQYKRMDAAVEDAVSVLAIHMLRGLSPAAALTVTFAIQANILNCLTSGLMLKSRLSPDAQDVELAELHSKLFNELTQVSLAEGNETLTLCLTNIRAALGAHDGLDATDKADGRTLSVSELKQMFHDLGKSTGTKR